MILPEPLEDQFWQELKLFEEAQKAAYITNAERIGMRRGMEQATLKIAQKMLREGLDIETIARFTELSIEQVGQLEPTESSEA